MAGSSSLLCPQQTVLMCVNVRLSKQVPHEMHSFSHSRLPGQLSSHRGAFPLPLCVIHCLPFLSASSWRGGKFHSLYPLNSPFNSQNKTKHCTSAARNQGSNDQILPRSGMHASLHIDLLASDRHSLGRRRMPNTLQQSAYSGTEGLWLSD